MFDRTVGVRQDDVWALSPQLQSDLLQVTAARGLLNQVTHLRDADTEVGVGRKQTQATTLLPLRIHLETGLSADILDLKQIFQLLWDPRCTLQSGSGSRSRSYLCRSGEGHLVDIHVPGDCSPSCRPHPGQDVHNTFRKAHLEEEAGKTL